MRESTIKKIDLLTKITCFDHHKNRDGAYEIGYYYNAFSGKGEWFWSHNGYIWTDEYSGGFKTFEEAEDNLCKRLDKEWAENVKWFEEFNDPDWDTRPKHLIENLPSMKQEYEQTSSRNY